MSSYLAGCGVCALTSSKGSGDALWGLSLTLPSQVRQTQYLCTEAYYMERGGKFDKLLATESLTYPWAQRAI